MSVADQNAVVNAPLVDMSVIAGAGSGKTKTSIGRVLSILNRLPPRKRVALLSFSNVAVNTFQHGLTAVDCDSSRTTVATFDSFFTQHVVLPHSWRLMGCEGRPYLVLGDEPFLTNFTIHHQGRPQSISELKIAFANGSYRASLGNSPVPWPVAQDAISRLGRTGAYTYDIARFWTHATLTLLPHLAQLLVHRYPYIMIDEAQDIGSMDWAIVQLLRQHGVRICLVGDPAQAIFGFNGGSGHYLRELGQTAGAAQFSLRTNFRSVPSIVHCANRLASRQDSANRAALTTHSGAFILPYDPQAPRGIVDRFTTVAQQLFYSSSNRGAGLVKRLVKAAEFRVANRYDRAFSECVMVIAALLDPAVPRFASLVRDTPDGLAQLVRARIWRFTCDHQGGLPSPELIARDTWLPQLLGNMRGLLRDLGVHGLTFADIGRRLTARDLDATSLIAANPTWRVDTVHQVKGESIGAVLYIATERHAQALLGGIDTEDGRIGYVALTRAKDLFWLAVPDESYRNLVHRAAAVGIMPLPGGI
jgi:hypothetical protein